MTNQSHYDMVRLLDNDLASGELGPWDVLTADAQRAIRRIGIAASEYDRDRAAGFPALRLALSMEKVRGA